jgi:hypothetical protein
MASLESLANPLERLSVLPTTMNLRKNPATGAPVWSALIQYFLNDMVVSSVDGGMYVMTGGSAVYPNELTTIRGGVDPSADTSGVWVKTFPNGVSFYSILTPSVASASAGVLTVTGGSQAVPENTDWLVVVTATSALTSPAVYAAGQYITWSVAGTGGTTVSWDVVPNVGIGSVSWSGSGLVSVGTGTTPTVTLTGAWIGAQPATVSASVLLIRLF